MPLQVNLRQLETRELRLEGDLPVAELDLEQLDELMQPIDSLHYKLMVQQVEKGLLVQGELALPLACECARCLRPFRSAVQIPGYCVLLSWEGEDPVVVRHDCVDLTPQLREDIVLALPQRPLCEPECAGLADRSSSSSEASNDPGRSGPPASAWTTLNKLDL
jgi:uncharacterized metal-binding protein YceD (DUF177 family)